MGSSTSKPVSQPAPPPSKPPRQEAWTPKEEAKPPQPAKPVPSPPAEPQDVSPAKPAPQAKPVESPPPAPAVAPPVAPATKYAAQELGPTMPQRWKKGDPIGSGSFGSVYLGLNSETGELLAVKEVSVTIDGNKQKEAVEQLEREVALLSQLNHPNIVRYVGTLREGNSLWIFLEYVPGGSIASLVQRFGPLDEAVIRVYTRQLLCGLAYLHAQRTVHRDVKGANLLVEKTGRIKLADFGMAKQMVEQVSFTKSFKGSAFWMAPEVIKQQGHGVAADIWSVGCTVLEMATGKPPWSQCTTQVQAIFKIASSQELPAIPESLSPAATEFVLLCLQREPSGRPSAEQLLQHPFVKNLPANVPALQVEPGAYAHVHPGHTAALPASLSAQASGTHLPGAANGAAAASGHAAAPGPPPPLPRSSSNGGAAGAPRHQRAVSSEDLTESLAAMVLGDSIHFSKAKASGTGLQDKLPWKTSSEPAGGASAAEGLEDGIDFTVQPQHFKVKGLLSLPPLRMLQGQPLPALQFNALMAGSQNVRPSTAASTTSITSSRA